MQKLTKQALNQLMETSPDVPAVTMYLPGHRIPSPPNMSEDQIRFKNLSRRALELLEQRDKHAAFNKTFMRQCNQLLRNKAFWEHMADSMVICARPGMFTYYHLPIDSDEYVAVDNHFHLTPLIGIMHDMREYYVLTVTQHKPTLFKGDMYELRRADLALPENIKSALNIDEMHRKNLQFSSTNSTKGAMYHGHGGAKDAGDEERLKFFRLIDSMVCYDIDTSLPLILAGAESEVAEFRALSRHPGIAKHHLDLNNGTDNERTLFEKASAVIQDEVVQQEHKAAIEKFKRLRGQSPGRTASYMDDLQYAAENGQVDTLLVGMSRETRDTVHDSMTPAPKLVFPAEEDSQTVDYLARQVFSQKGSIVNVPQDEMPDRKLVLAINRY